VFLQRPWAAKCRCWMKHSSDSLSAPRLLFLVFTFYFLKTQSCPPFLSLFFFIFFLVFISVSSLFFFFVLSLSQSLSLAFFFFSFFLWLMGLTRWGEVEVPCSSRALSVFGSASLLLLVSSRLVLPPAFYRAGLLVVHLLPSLPFQDEDKCGLGCWCSARTRTPTVPPWLDCWWWILTRTLAVYLEGQHDWLGTLGRPHRSVFAAFEPPVMGGILNFVLTGSFLCLQRKKTMIGNETAPFLGWGGSFSIWSSKLTCCN